MSERFADTRTKRCCKWHLDDSNVIVQRCSSGGGRNFVRTAFSFGTKNHLFFPFPIDELLFMLFIGFHGPRST